MDRSQSRIAIFWENLVPQLRQCTSSPEAINSLLTQILTKCEQEWADFRVERTLFLVHLARCLTAHKSDLDQSLRAIHAQDIYLALACAQGDGQALSTFEKKYDAVIRAVLAKFRLSEETQRDLQQDIYKRILVKDEDHQPKILQYTGLGTLKAWIRAVSARQALHYLRDRTDEVHLEEEVLVNLAAACQDASLKYFQHQFRTEFRASFRAALQSLTVQERNLLRHRVLDGLGIAEIMKMMRMSRPTVFRCMTRIRQKILRITRKELTQKLDLQKNEVTGIVRNMMSQLSVSISGSLLRKDQSD